METIAAKLSENNYKFSEPLKVGNIAIQSKDLEKNDGLVYNFSRPLDVPSPITSAVGIAPTNTALHTGLGKKFKRSRTEWECDVCMIRNKLEVEKCVACETPCQPMTSLNDSSFGQQFKKSQDKWECDTCMIQNTLESTKCIACETPRTGSKLRTFESPFGNTFKPKSDNWECPTCMISNKLASSACVACETKKPMTLFKTLAAQQKASKWECSACLTQNDNDNNKCVCCEQQKPGYTKVESKEASPSGGSKFTFGFGNGLNAPTENDLKKASSNESTETIKAKVGSWECTTCKTSNKNEANVCLACQSKKPVPIFKFGFANAITTPGDTSFKALAAQQKTCKWECSACMTQNDNNNNKCVCCEQQKPGNIKVESKEASPSGGSKFTFGFGNRVHAKTENVLSKTSSSENAGNVKADSGFKALAVQQRSSKWECLACMTQNDINKAKCVCCAQPKPEPIVSESKNDESKHNTAATTKFHFGFGDGKATEEELKKDLISKSGQKNTTADDGFRTLAAQQKLSKWECEACMTPNDNNISKCACCGQTRVAEKMESVKQLHSDAAAPKFSFGFGNGVNAPTEEDLKKQLETK